MRIRLVFALLLFVSCASKKPIDKTTQDNVAPTLSNVSWVGAFLNVSCDLDARDAREIMVCEDELEVVVETTASPHFLDERINFINNAEGADHFQSAPFIIGEASSLEVLRTEFTREEQIVAVHLGASKGGQTLSCWAKESVAKNASLCERVLLELAAGRAPAKVEAGHWEVDVLGESLSLPKGCHRGDTNTKETNFECFNARLRVQKHESLVRASTVMAAIEAETNALGLDAGRRIDCDIQEQQAQCVMWELSKEPPIRVLVGLVLLKGSALTFECKAEDPLYNPLCSLISQRKK